MPRVESSVMFRIHYEEALRQLDVIFRSGRIYTYFDVPKPLYEQFVKAESHGEFFNAHIRDAYRFVERARGWRRKP
jgi:KTSC domain-containing protein